MKNSYYFDTTTKVIFVTVNIKQSDLSSILSFFVTFRILNVVIVGKFKGKEKLKVFSYNPFLFTPLKKSLYQLDIDVMRTDEVFPDKLLDLNGYMYRVCFYDDPPKTHFLNGNVYGESVPFIETVAHKQNAIIGGVFFERNSNLDRNINTAFETGQIDFCINSMVIQASDFKSKNSVNIYDTDGYCCLVPIADVKHSFDFLLTPFDALTWIFIVASMIMCAIVWHFLNATSTIRSNSAPYFIYGFVSSFFGQMIPFRRHRVMQKTVMQLTIILTFILGTAYQSLIIGSILCSRYVPKLSSINELINGNYSFYVSKSFSAQLGESDYYSEINKKIILHQIDFINVFDFKYISSQNIAIIDSCKLIDVLLNNPAYSSSLDESAAEYYYKLDEKFNTHYLEFPTSKKSFFMNRLQEFSLRIFESGLKQLWSKINPVEDIKGLKERKYFENEEYLLTLFDILPAFYVLIFGLKLSTLTLLIEIHAHDFLGQLNWHNFVKKFIVNKQPAKVHQIIQVRSLYEVETNI